MALVHLATEHEQLFQYSEWLDSQGIIASESASGDCRSHEELVAQFVKENATSRE